MASSRTEQVLKKTLQFMRKTDPDLTAILARSTVVWIGVWKPDENASSEEQKAGKGAWMDPYEGPLFICSRASPPHYQLVVKPRSQVQKLMSFDITDSFHFCAKKPNLQIAETDEKDIFNLYFTSDTEGSENFDKIVHVLQQIKEGQGQALEPLASENVQPRNVAPLSSEVATSSRIKVGELFSALPPAPSPPQPPVAPTMSATAFAQPQEVPAAQPPPIPAALPASGGTPPAAGAHAIPAATSAMEAQLSATELIARLTGGGAGSGKTPAASVPTQIPPPAAAPPPARSSPQLPTQLGSSPTTPARSRHPGGPLGQSAPRPPPPDSPEQPGTSIMASLFGPPADAGAQKASRAASFGLPASASSPASAYGGQAQPSRSQSGQPPFPAQPPGTHRHSGPLHGTPNAVDSSDRSNSGAQIGGARPPLAAALEPGAGGHSSQGDLDGRRNLARKLLDVLAKDDRFVDALADALDAVGLQSVSGFR